MMKPVYKKTVLDNGIRVVTETFVPFRSISIGMWVNVGSRDEPTGQGGITHAIEHMAFKGTKKRSAQEIAQSLESLGGHLNAFTTREQTCYYARILDEHLPVAVDVLADMVLNPSMTASDLQKEKKVILEEIKDVLDNPGDLIHDIFAETIWEGHPLGRPIIGSSESVSSFRSLDLRDYMRKHYHGDTLVISAAGNVNHSKLVRLVERKLKIRNGVRNSGGRRSYPRSYRAVKVTKRDSAQTHLCLGVPAVRYSHPDRLGLAVLNVLLGGGMSSRLFQTIRERLSLVYSIYSFLESYEDSGIWGIYLATDAGQLPRAIDYSLRELKKVKLNAVSKRELEDAKSQIKGNTVIGLESSSSRMHRLARNELYLRRYIPLDQTISDINKIKVDDIHRIAREMFRPENYSAAVLGPVNNGLGKSLQSGLNN